MRTERDSAIRLLQLLMVASLVFPAALFAYASYNDYHDVYAVADERIDRSLDVLQEHDAESLRDRRPHLPGGRRGGARHVGRSDPRRASKPDPAAAAHRRRHAAGAGDHLDRRRRPPAGVQRAGGVRRRRRFRRPALLRGTARQRHRNLCRRRADLDAAGPGNRAVRRVAAAAGRRWIVPRRHRRCCAAALFRRLLCDDRAVTGKFLRAGASRRAIAGALSLRAAADASAQSAERAAAVDRPRSHPRALFGRFGSRRS